MVHKDMYEKNLFRNGVDLNTLYQWYSAEIAFTKPEFGAKVLPYIQKYLNESPEFRKTLNRQGIQVWKLTS